MIKIIFWAIWYIGCFLLGWHFTRIALFFLRKRKIHMIIKIRYNGHPPSFHKSMRKHFGDEAFLRFLESEEKCNPRPVYKNPLQ